MDVRLRFRGIGLLLTLLICSPVLAQDPENEEALPRRAAIRTAGWILR